ncbi:MAG: AAA family ATPase [Methanomassiliicoccaceae archaeon]|nr:AAA family ATPase [Methanomassiliicoccaceae archaeon]
MRIMFVGTSSNAGKTVITALFCRYLRTKTIMVSPFKALNLSSKAFVTENGTEIGVGQALQAWASDLEPSGRMNPVLLKVVNRDIELYVNGKREDGRTFTREMMLNAALRSYDEMCDMYDIVVAEGSGSPAEINLFDGDIANTGLASARQIPMILIGDIEKGGVFAGIYGTWLLMKEEHRKLLKGFIINKYYGDKEILKSGIERIESLTGMRCMGIFPHMNIQLPEEDVSVRKISGVHNIDEYLETLDRITGTISEHIDMEGILRIASE